MSWVRVDIGLKTHQKTILLARALKVSLHEAVGLLVDLWSLAQVRSWRDGCLKELGPEGIDLAVGWGRRKQSFARSAQHIGFLDKGWTVHDWDHYSMSPNLKREQAKTRMRNIREQKRTEANRSELERTVTHSPSDTPSPSPTPTANNDTRASPRETYSPGFEEFWAAYPNRKGKGAAYRAWSRVKQHQALIMAALPFHRDSEQWQREGGRFIPHPSTWLNQRRWEDDLHQDDPDDIVKQYLREDHREFEQPGVPTAAYQAPDAGPTD